MCAYECELSYTPGSERVAFELVEKLIYLIEDNKLHLLRVLGSAMGQV